jgi:uncharacterized membrane protein YsdA (DUF1294 family)
LPPTPPRTGRRRPRLPFRPIVAGFLLAAAGFTFLAAWLLTSQLNWLPLLAFLAAVNLATFAAYFYDKSVARSATRLWRIPEPVLHLLAVAGGTPAAFAGQKLLRHKTLKQPFRAWFWTIVAAQVICLSGWVYYTQF